MHVTFYVATKLLTKNETRVFFHKNNGVEVIYEKEILQLNQNGEKLVHFVMPRGT